MSTEDEAPPDRSLLAPTPTGRAARWRVALGCAWVALMLLLPLRYYASEDAYDERFAWRMFSAVRVRPCEMSVREARQGREQPVNLTEILPQPWIELLRRNRPAVITRFLAWRCEQSPDTARVTFENRCRDAEGAALPPVVHTLECAPGRAEGGAR